MVEQTETEHATYESLHVLSPLPYLETDNLAAEIPQEKIDPSTDNGKKVQVKASSSILVVGATGLVGLRIVKYLQKVATPEQTIYVLARRHLFRERPGVIVKVTEASNWPLEIAQIPNLTTVYSAIGVRAPSMYQDPQMSVTPDQFYLVYHNLNYQVAEASKAAGASTFVLVSNYLVSSPFFRIFSRKIKMTNALEKDLQTMNFERLMIFRPGPLIGVREKTGTLKGFSFSSIVNSFEVMALEPMLFFNIYYPFTTFNFATSVAKASVIFEKEEPTGAVERFNGWHIMYGAYQYNMMAYQNVFDQATEPLDHFKVEAGLDIMEQTGMSAICEELKSHN